MALSCPYAPAANVIGVIRRYRSLNLPNSLDTADVRTAGVPDGMIHRTVFALRFLSLLDDSNQPTGAWRSLCSTGDEEYPSTLLALVRTAYADVFRRIDPETDGMDRVKSAFQAYDPKSQIDRMVVLFLALCKEAGVAVAEAPKRRTTRALQTNGFSKTRDRRVSAPLPTQPVRPPDTSARIDDVLSAAQGPTRCNYSAVQAVVDRLPATGQWTRAQRDKWITAMTGVVDLSTEIIDGAGTPLANGKDGI